MNNTCRSSFNNRGAGRGLPVAPTRSEYWDQMSGTSSGSSSYMDPLGRSRIHPLQTPVKQSVRKSYVAISTDDETDRDEQTTSDLQQRRQSIGTGFSSLASSPEPPVSSFQRNSKVYRSFGGFGTAPISRPPPRGIMRKPKAAPVAHDAQPTTGQQIEDNPVIAARRRFRSGEAFPTAFRDSDSSKNQKKESVISNVGKSTSDRPFSMTLQSSNHHQPVSTSCGQSAKQPASSGLMHFVSDQLRVMGGFGRGFPARKT